MPHDPPLFGAIWALLRGMVGIQVMDKILHAVYCNHDASAFCIYGQCRLLSINLIKAYTGGEAGGGQG